MPASAANTGGSVQVAVSKARRAASPPLRRLVPSAHFRYGSIALPSEADGEFGTAPVLAAEVGYDPQTQTWSRRMLFDVPAAMHACCELLWMNSEAINGFPDVRLEHSPAAVQQAARLNQAE